MSYLKKLTLLSIITIMAIQPVAAYSLTSLYKTSTIERLPAANKNTIAAAMGAGALFGAWWYGWSQNNQKRPFDVSLQNGVLNLKLKNLKPQNAFLRVNNDKVSDYLTSSMHYGCSADADMAFAYINRGQKVLKNVLSGTYQSPATATNEYDAVIGRHAYLQDIVGMCWQLFARASTKDQAFSNGTLVVHDNGKIYNMLLEYVKQVNPDNWASCVAKSANPYGYCRHSTHFKTAQKNGYDQYGIDIRFGDPIAWYEYIIPGSKRQQPVLPGAKKHILFGRLDEQRTFIKMEDDGLYLYDGWAQHAAGAVFSVGRKLGFGSNDHKEYRKEHMPANIARKAQEIINNYNLALLAPKTIGEIIAASAEYIQFTPLAAQLRNTYDHVEGRFGNEVILTKDELRCL